MILRNIAEDSEAYTDLQPNINDENGRVGLYGNKNR